MSSIELGTTGINRRVCSTTAHCGTKTIRELKYTFFPSFDSVFGQTPSIPVNSWSQVEPESVRPNVMERNRLTQLRLLNMSRHFSEVGRQRLHRTHGHYAHRVASCARHNTGWHFVSFLSSRVARKGWHQFAGNRVRVERTRAVPSRRAFA